MHLPIHIRSGIMRAMVLMHLPIHKILWYFENWLLCSQVYGAKVTRHQQRIKSQTMALIITLNRALQFSSSPYTQCINYQKHQERVLRSACAQNFKTPSLCLVLKDGEFKQVWQIFSTRSIKTLDCTDHKHRHIIRQKPSVYNINVLLLFSRLMCLVQCGLPKNPLIPW